MRRRQTRSTVPSSTLRLSNPICGNLLPQLNGDESALLSKEMNGRQSKLISGKKKAEIPKELDGRQQLGVGPFAGVAAEQSDESLLEADGQRRQNVADLIVQLEKIYTTCVEIGLSWQQPSDKGSEYIGGIVHDGLQVDCLMI